MYCKQVNGRSDTVMTFIPQPSPFSSPAVCLQQTTTLLLVSECVCEWEGGRGRIKDEDWGMRRRSGREKVKNREMRFLSVQLTWHAI